jgi:hypothetical protein
MLGHDRRRLTAETLNFNNSHADEVFSNDNQRVGRIEARKQEIANFMGVRRDHYVPAFRYHWLTLFYDLLVRWSLREDRFTSRWVAPAQIKGKHLCKLREAFRLLRPAGELYVVSFFTVCSYLIISEQRRITSRLVAELFRRADFL